MPRTLFTFADRSAATTLNWTVNLASVVALEAIDEPRPSQLVATRLNRIGRKQSAPFYNAIDRLTNGGLGAGDALFQRQAEIAEAFFRDVDSEVKDMPRDLAKVPEIGDRYQIRFVRQ